MKFEIVKADKRTTDVSITLPQRQTVGSAGYDFFSPVKTEIEVGETKVIWTDVKCKLKNGYVLLIFPRSSVGIKHGVILANSTGVIDSDYYGNQSNDGNIGIALRNMGSEKFIVNEGDRIAQGVILPYVITSDDNTKGERTGGVGSTGK